MCSPYRTPGTQGDDGGGGGGEETDPRLTFARSVAAITAAPGLEEPESAKHTHRCSERIEGERRRTTTASPAVAPLLLRLRLPATSASAVRSNACLLSGSWTSGPRVFRLTTFAPLFLMPETGFPLFSRYRHSLFRSPAVGPCVHVFIFVFPDQTSTHFLEQLLTHTNILFQTSNRQTTA